MTYPPSARVFEQPFKDGRSNVSRAGGEVENLR